MAEHYMHLSRHRPNLAAAMRRVNARRPDLERLAVGEEHLARLLPDVWAAAHPDAIHSYSAHQREAQAAAKRARPQRRHALEQAKAQRR